MQVTVFFSAVAEYSGALKESIKSQTEYLAQASLNMSKVRTDDIFTNILMQHGRKPVEETHVKRKEHLRQYGQISGKQIKSSQEIFIPTDGKHPESVLVTGKAGIGKTLFCQKLIRDWADNKLFRSRANAEVPDFKFAYLLTFRQLNLLGDDPVTLKDILNRSSVLDDHSNIDDSIFEYILHHSEEVLIIIDGYDECSQREYIASDSDEKYPNNAKEKMPVAALCAKLIKGKILRGSVVMITSRPDESDEMKDREIYFDRYVEITGFSEPQVKEYIGKYFKNNDRMKNIVMDHITKNVNLVSFAHIPVLCFLMCSYFEYTLQQPKKNNPLPVKTSDLYDEVVNMFVKKHDRKKSASVEETLDELSKLAAQLLLERKFLFLKEDLKTLNLHEVESLCGSGLLHCGPPFRTSPSATTKHFCFTHLTLQEYLAARWFVKTRTIPPRDVSTEVVLFMSGILSKQNNNEFEEKLIIHKFLSDDLLADEATRGHLISKCLLQYEDIEFAKGIVKRFQDVFCINDGCFDLSYVDIASLDYAAVPFTLNVFGALNAEDESEWSRITELRLTGRKVTDAGVASLSQALQKPTCKVTVLDLDSNQITNAGVASLCQALQTPTCEVTKLDLSSNKITDAGVASLSQALQTPTCKVTKLDLSSNKITDAGVASLSQALKTPTCNITTLDLSSNQITDASVTSLCQALQTPTCEVTRLNLEDNQITDAGVASLSQALQTTKVTELFLSSNLIADAGVKSLCQALKTPTSKITKLSLDNSQFTITAVASLRQALQTPTCKVTLLHLSVNRINDACVTILSQALRTPTCKVTDLSLGGNQITNAGVASLCQALQTPTCKVTELHLSANQIADAGAARLCQALQTPTCKVTKLLLGDNQITDAGVASLSQALKTPTCKVTELFLNGNLIADAGVASLCEALQKTTCKVTNLSLSRNQITDAGFARLSQALQTSTCKVTELYLNRNQITDAGVSSLCQALQTPTFTVTKLYLRNNQITDAGVASLLQASKPAACKVFF